MATEPLASLTAIASRPVTLVDSSVILDIVTEDPAWSEWSAAALAEALDDGALAINQSCIRGVGRLAERPDQPDRTAER